MKNVLKSILKSDGVRRFACWLGSLYIRLVWRTSSWDVQGRAPLDERADAGLPTILCFWHGRLLVMPCCWQRPEHIQMLISEHRDGALIANIIKHFGIGWIKGSTSKSGTQKGGAQALRAILKSLKSGEYVGVTPDGPRGPRMRASEGVVLAAKMSGAAIIPVTYGIRSGKVLGTWDRFLIGWPFSKGVVLYGAPIEVPKNADADALENARQQLEDSLNDRTAECDRLTARDPVMPADQSWERPA